MVVLKEWYIRKVFETHSDKATIDKAKELKKKDSSDAAVGTSVGSQAGPVVPCWMLTFVFAAFLFLSLHMVAQFVFNTTTEDLMATYGL